MQVVDDGRHVRFEEHFVGAHRVTSQEGLALLGHETLDVGQDLFGCLFHRHATGVQVIKQSGGGMHVAHEVIHVLQRVRRRCDENVHAGVDDCQVAVGDDNRHFDEGITRDIKACHFAVNPDQGVFQSFHALHVSARLVIRLGGSRLRWPLLHWKGIGRSFHAR